MRGSTSKLEQALKDLIEAYSELDTELTAKLEDDEEAYASSMLESLETSIESALEDQDMETKSFANLLSYFSDALEQLDPVAFDEEGESDEEEEEYEDDEDDTDYDEDEDEEEEEEK